MDDAPSDDPDFNKQYAARALTRVDYNRAFSSEQVATTAKWLTASLLAVNGAGALAAMNSMAAGNSTWLPAMLFLAGVGFALLGGVGLQAVYNKVPDPLFEQDKYWTNVSITGTRNAEREEELRGASARATRFAVVPEVMGWVSGILFFTSSIVLGVQVQEEGSSDEKRCSALQQTMLSKHPDRLESRELFKALGCQPHSA